ncbi:MAG: hypothetical protein OEZ06_02045 [Myxococcales bacterium]|nr:hypothetical protein [Myxococcales bacterium]
MGAGCGSQTCDPNAVCDQGGAEHSCVCTAGYEGDGESCEDIDECADADLNDCDANATCENRPGSFGCSCKAGFLGDGRSCTGVDECQGANTCDPNATCINQEGGFGCECNAGYSGDGFGCGDVDECADSELFSCAQNASCKNTFGGFDCECDPTFAGEGDVECQGLCEIALGDSSVCAGDGLCRIDGTEAVCNACVGGFTGDGKSCTAASDCPAECDGADDVGAVCTGDAGSRTCECASGYSGSPGSCTDVDECATDNGGCGDSSDCINTDGGHFCACKTGYARDGSGACADVDECAQDASPCHPEATCENTDGGFECACPDGFEGDGSVCTDIDECAEGGGNDCAANSSCVNERGGFTCECRAPLTGDDPSACYCDLSGFWAMRQDLDTCWDALTNADITAISAGSMEAWVWELHRLSYDGDTIVVEKKGCGSDNTPDLISPLFGGETYSSYVPDGVFDDLPLAKGVDIAESGIVPGATFTTPPEAAVVGIDLGDDPLNASWPAAHDLVNAEGSAAPAWTDVDGDGEPGLTLWPHLPSETTEAGTRNYDYLPAELSAVDSSIVQRAGCVSVATRIITHLEVEVEDCTEMVGKVINESSQGRVRSCTLVPESAWDSDLTCNPDDWPASDAAERCTSDHVGVLDDDQNQSQKSVATFKLVKIGSLDEDVTCTHVRQKLEAEMRSAPTITCK